MPVPSETRKELNAMQKQMSLLSQRLLTIEKALRDYGIDVPASWEK